MSARAAAGASSERCIPMSGMSSTATGTLQGFAGLSMTMSLACRDRAGIGKPHDTPGQRLGRLRRKLPYREPDIGGKPSRRIALPAAIDVPDKRLAQGRV